MEARAITAAFAAGTLCWHRAPGCSAKAITVVQLRALILASGGKPAGPRAALVDIARLLVDTTTVDTTSSDTTCGDTATTAATSTTTTTTDDIGDTDYCDQDGPDGDGDGDGGDGDGTPAAATSPATPATSPPTTHVSAAFRVASENPLLSSPRF